MHVEDLFYQEMTYSKTAHHGVGNVADAGLDW